MPFSCCKSETNHIVSVVCMMIMLFVSPWAYGQRFIVHGTSGTSQRTTGTLTIYDGDRTSRTLQCNVGESFSLEDKVDHPVLASFITPLMTRPFFFYIENSDITIAINPQEPELSRVSGSRTNSQFRYEIENCSGAGEQSCLIDYVEHHPTSAFAPFVLYSRLSVIPVEQMQRLYDMLDGEAAHTYHYHLLKERLARKQAVAEGAVMPDFVFTNRDGREQHLDSVLAADSCNAIVVGASWCKKCNDAERQIREINPAVRVHSILVDRQAQRWDSPVMQLLVVDHIPYIILLDASGVVTGRDLRVWEMKRRIAESGCDKSPDTASKK